MGLVWVLNAGSMSGSLGAAGWARGWMCTSSPKFWATSGAALHKATTRSTAREKRAENCLPYSIGPTKSAPRREATRVSYKAGQLSLLTTDSSTISKSGCHLFVRQARFLCIFFLLSFFGSGPDRPCYNSAFPLWQLFPHFGLGDITPSACQLSKQ